MARSGPKPKPSLAVVREGNPGKRRIKDTVQLPPSALREPEWNELIIGRDREAQYIRGVARDTWRRVAPTLARSVGLVDEQRNVLIEYCVTWARIVQGERALSRQGVLVAGAMGTMVKNPWTTALNQYRTHFRSLVGELGLSPSAASRITRPESSDDDDPFD